MKTIKIISTAFSAIFMMSCGTYYRMTTTLDRDGNAVREVYAIGDSAFMAGNMSHNPYLFDISPDWKITRFDSAMKYDFFETEQKDINVKVSKSAFSIDLFSKEISCEQDKRSFAATEETLTKQFRWFYTNYTFKGVYKRLGYDAPVPIGKYLSKEEQKLWTQGDFSSYGVMNGSEMNDVLGGIEEEFMNWYARNLFEISLNCIEKLSNEKIVRIDKDKLFKQINDQRQEVDTPQKACEVLDAFYETTRFSELCKANEKTINEEFAQSTAVVNLIHSVISYELIVPGEVISTNSPIVNANTLIWKVDGIRILFDDYMLTAQYRVANRWAFIISGLILITVVTSVLLLLKKRRSI